MARHKDELSSFFGLQLDDDQQHYLDLLQDDSVRLVMVQARAGSGKTTIAVGAGLMQLERGTQDEILYLRSTPQEKQGYLPGTLEEKTSVYWGPLYDALYALGYQPQKYVKQLAAPQAFKNGTAIINAGNINYNLGCNYDRKWIILDQAEQFTAAELKRTLTRVKDSAKVIIIGSLQQTSIKASGFAYTLDYFSHYDWAASCRLTKNYRGIVSAAADEMIIGR